MTSARPFTTALLLLLALAAPAAADPAPPSRIDVGVAGTLPFMKGAGGEVGWVPGGTRIRPNLSAFTVEVPVALLGDNDGWSRRDAGVALGVDYFFGAGARGFYLGANVTGQLLHYGYGGDTLDVYEADINAAAGYHWRPLRGRGLYVTPGLLVIAPIASSDDPVIAGETFEEKLPVRIVPLLNLGWEL